ncbi:MAG TPA: lysozyme inhibitor LprI family protein [Candidatus Acidoferrales bacterium]|nr:lysozyme inhibitor LprI family protein [Candidatus Acidoferrales bacterium]
MQTKTIIVFFSAVFLFGSGNPTDAQTQSQMTEQACGEFKKADAELNRVYQQILAARAGDAVFVKAFREAQRAWIAFRDAHLKSIYPDPFPREAYGSANPMCQCGDLQELTAQRTKQLRKLWLEGGVAGDVCAGSTLIQHPITHPAPTKK